MPVLTTIKPYFCAYMILTRASNGKPVSLGNQIASSGEGEVWETNESGILAKIYHNPTRDRIEKLKVMLANPPADPMASQNHFSIAFPQDLLKDRSGADVGFLMPAIRQSRELTTVYNPSLRKRKAPGFNWYYLHATALNTAWIIQSIHEKGYVLGDIKPQNILVNDRALVAVIDTDSFQVRDRNTGKVYRCTVGSEGFTPVELLGKDFSTTDRTEICDRFRLAVLIHYLLFGYHPFSGQWIGAGDSPEQNELIRKGFWYGGQNSLIRPSLNTIPFDVVHPEIKRCFLKCFNDGHTSPHLRPTAKDWHNALQVAINELIVCSKVNNHIYNQYYGKCYWCERAEKLGVDIFPFVPGAATIIVKPTTIPSTVTQTVSSSKTKPSSSIDARSYYVLGMHKAKRERYQEAIKDFSHALCMNSNYAEAYRYRGLTYAKLQYNQTAIEDLKKAADLYLHQEKIDSYQDVLESLKKLQPPERVTKKGKKSEYDKISRLFPD